VAEEPRIAPPPGVEPQHLVLVLPSTGEFDSRTYRIATTCLARGHRVTVLARWKPGLPRDASDPTGYRIVRVEASTIDGLPFPGLVRWTRDLVRRSRRRPLEGPPATPARTATRSETSHEVGPAGTGAAATSAAAWAPQGLLSRGLAKLAIPLTMRSHRRRARGLDPGGDLYHGMAYMGIPVALDLARRHRAAVVYDARDIYLEARNLARMRGPVRWWLARAERGWARAAGRVVTVNRAYADVMSARWGVDPLVVMNCSYRYDPPDPPEHRFHGRLGLEPGTRVVLYHGGLVPERGIEELIAAIELVPDATLVLMGYGASEDEYRRRAATTGGRVRLMPAVPPAELHDWVASADVVAMPIQPTTLNHDLTTPNKLFEAIAAGVPVVASDLPGMAAIVGAVGAGVLVDPTDAASVAAGIRSLLDEPAEARTRRRARILAAAHDRYNWEVEADRLLAQYGRLTGRPW
jgi:glycosyltransferase involved in cell wall biosynthesis